MLSLLTFSVAAETRLIVPLATTHIGGGDFNNENYGIGGEYKDMNDYVFCALYLANNSYSERSLYLSASKEFDFKHHSASAGLAVANGYEAISDSGILVTPVFSLTYESFRIATSFPAAQIFCPPGEDCGDFVNLQYVHEF